MAGFIANGCQNTKFANISPLQNHQLDLYSISLMNLFIYLFIYCLVHPACRILAHYTSNQSLLSALPQLGIYLYVSELIKEMTLPQGDALLAQVKEAVCKDYTKLETFAKVLCKSAATVEIGYSIMREYSKYLYYNIDQ